MECRYCKKSFSKGEHLRRHERRHTGDKPFVCGSCQRTFNRQDSLARHRRLHGHESQQQHHPQPQHQPQPQPQPVALSSIDEGPQAENGAGEIPHAAAGMNFEQLTAQDLSSTLFANNGTSNVLNDFPQSEADLPLIWPDSEDLFQSILNAGSLWQLPPGTFPLPTTLSASESVNAAAGAATTAEPAEGSDTRAMNFRGMNSEHALNGVRQMISNFSSNLTEAVDATSITSVFLDQCLHMFFDRFIPIFPIMHRPTFVYRHSSSPLLLNAIAIGSLFLGPTESVAKGEVIWRLAHSAVATSWQTLITQQSQYEACAGVQLALAALLSVIYGVLSRNDVIRGASQALHASAFFWARQCGFFECQPYNLADLPHPSATIEQKEHQWRLWAAREIQQRAMLSHYILDGLIAHMLGKSTSVRHTSNTLKLPNAELAFQAKSVDQWLLHMRSLHTEETSFRDVYKRLFVPYENPQPMLTGCANLSLRVLLEGTQSIIADSDPNDGAIINPPSPQQIASSLLWIYDTTVRCEDLGQVEKLEVLLRWHAVCLEAITKTPQLCLYICKRFKVSQDLWPNRTVRDNEFDLPALVNQPAGRRLLLHAVAIQDLVEQLPRGRAHAVHMPSSLFAAASIYAAFSLGNQANVRLPSSVHWASVLSSANLDAQSQQPQQRLDEATLQYVHHNRVPPTSTAITFKNVLYELNSVQKLLHALKTQWGVASGMEKVIGQWIALCD